MRSRTIKYVAAMWLLALAFTGCRTTRQAEGGDRLTKKQRAELLEPLAQYPADIHAVSARITVTLDYNGNPVSLKGRLRMRCNEVVQMSITALGLMEVAVIEFTPKCAYLIDRINKRYALFDYSSGWMNSVGISFGTVQALFWNRIFIPGVETPWREAGSFTLSSVGSQCVVEPGRQRMLKCRFYTDADCKQLQQTDLTLQQYEAIWRYEQFESFGSYTCPTAFNVSVSGTGRSAGAHVMLSDISTFDTGWKGNTDLSRYKQVDLEQLLSILEMIR